MATGSDAIPRRLSRRWRHARMMADAMVFSADGSVLWVVPSNYILLRLSGEGDDPPTVLVPIPEGLLDAADVDIWPWVRDRANRAFRAGRLIAPIPRRWPVAPPPMPDELAAYDRFLAAFGNEEWHPRVYCVLPGRDWGAEATEAARSCVIVAVHAPGRWARVPVPEDMILDDPDDTAWLVKVGATHTWEALAQRPPDAVS